jgi:O-methyltransferase
MIEQSGCTTHSRDSWIAQTIDGWVNGDFNDQSTASYEIVSEYLSGHKNKQLIRGYFPDSVPQPAMDRRYAFVHYDADTYQSCVNFLDFFYPRMSQGGIMLIDDYGASRCAGVTKAVDEHVAQHGGTIHSLPSTSVGYVHAYLVK